MALGMCVYNYKMKSDPVDDGEVAHSKPMAIVDFLIFF